MRLQTKFVVLVIGLGLLFAGASFAVLFALHAEAASLRGEQEAQRQGERMGRLLEARLAELVRLSEARLEGAAGDAPGKPADRVAQAWSAEQAAADGLDLVRLYLAAEPHTPAHAVTSPAAHRQHHDDNREAAGASAEATLDAATAAAVQVAIAAEQREAKTGLLRAGEALYEAALVPLPGNANGDALVGYVVVGRFVGRNTRHEPLEDLVVGTANEAHIEVLPLEESSSFETLGAIAQRDEPGRIRRVQEEGNAEAAGALGLLVPQLGMPQDPLLVTVRNAHQHRALLSEVLIMTVALGFGGLLLMAATIAGLHVLVVRRLQRLARYAERVRSSGDLGRRPVEDASSDEIGQLYRSVEMMLDRIEDQANVLRLTNEELMGALQAKDEFFHATSHELRTPLATIHGFLDRLERQLAAAGDDSAARGEPVKALAEIKRAAQHLLQLIDEMLELSRARAGKLPFELGPVDPLEVLEDVRALTASQAQTQAITLAFSEPSEEVPAVRADHRRLVQVLVNVVSNAIKYTGERGHVEIDLEVPSARYDVRIHVRDNGPGIEPSQQARLFEPFYRGPSRDVPGVGLGLAIVREFLERMNGHIAVESSPGHGSRFTVSLPVFAAWQEGRRPDYQFALPSQET